MRSAFHPEALAEFDEAIDFDDLESQGLGNRFEEYVQLAVTEIEESPRSWPIYEEGIRQHLVSVFPYAILYQEVYDYVLILAVMHTSRDPDYWKRRLN